MMKTKEQYLHGAALPPMLHLELTGKCNLKCKQCYNDSGCRETIMTPERWMEFSKAAAKDLFSVTLSGGEPLLLGKKLFDLMDVYEEKDVWINMISNGFLMDRSAAKRVSEHSIGWVEISIDAPNAADHDDLRGVQGSWKQAVLAASYLASYNVPVIIGTCVTPKQLGHLDDMADLAEQMGVTGVTFSKILVSGRAYFHQKELVMSDEETERFVQEVEAVRRDHPLLRINCATQSIADAVRDTSGSANYEIPIIRPDGKMRLSCFEPVIVCDVLAEDMQTLWERYKELRARLSAEPEKLAAAGINYVDKEISYADVL